MYSDFALISWIVSAVSAATAAAATISTTSVSLDFSGWCLKLLGLLLTKMIAQNKMLGFHEVFFVYRILHKNPRNERLVSVIQNGVKKIQNAFSVINILFCNRAPSVNDVVLSHDLLAKLVLRVQPRFEGPSYFMCKRSA